MRTICVCHPMHLTNHLRRVPETEQVRDCSLEQACVILQLGLGFGLTPATLM